MKDLWENWPEILDEASLVSSNSNLKTEFKVKRGENQEGAKDRFKKSIFYVILDSIIAGLTRRFIAVDAICNRFDFLWQFKEFINEMLTDKALQFQQKYARHVSSDIEVEIHRLKTVFDDNLKIETLRPREIYEEIYNLELMALFPN